MRKNHVQTESIPNGNAKHIQMKHETATSDGISMGIVVASNNNSITCMPFYVHFKAVSIFIVIDSIVLQTHLFKLIAS